MKNTICLQFGATLSQCKLGANGVFFKPRRASQTRQGLASYTLNGTDD